MGFYLRKSIKAGPFRFNFSKSGVGISAGIPGLHFGTGPSGNYVHMGRGGLYYRKTLGTQPSSRPSNNYQSLAQDQQDIIDPGHDGFKDIDSGDISALKDSSSTELLAEFDAKRKKIRAWPFVASLFFLSLFMVPPTTPDWVYLAILIIAPILTYVSYSYDQVRKSVVLFYEMEPEYEEAYKSLHEAFATLQRVRRIWHVEAQANVSDRKRHAGADQLIKKQAIDLTTKDAPYVKTNISIPSIPAGQQTLFFFPDRILVFDKNKVGAVSYKDLEITISRTKFIEAGSVPGDTQIVDHTWRYVNKSGGPDKRFNDNRQIPICLYEDMHLKSKTGLNEMIEFSKCDSVEVFANALVKISTILDGLKESPEEARSRSA